MKRNLLAVVPLLVSIWASSADPAQAQRPRFSIDAPLNLSGTPLELEVEVQNLRPNQRLKVLVAVDDKVVAEEQPLMGGKNAIELDGVRLTSGTHKVQVRTGAIVEEIEIRVLPGWLSVLPPLVAIALALVFRDVLIALFLGIFGGAMILNGWNPFAAFGRTVDTYIVPALADGDHASIIVFTCFLGGMVGLVTKSGGTHGIVQRLTPYATTRRRGQLATWFMGLFIFFDDYANTLIVGPTMRPITDKLRVSREKLAYLVDSTAAPVVCLFPISTWVGFEIGLIGDAFEQLNLPFDAYTTFVATLPYRFYPIFAIALVLVIVVSRYDFGPMRRAERRAMETGKLLEDGARPIADYSSHDVEPPEKAPRRAINAVLPILTVIVLTVVGLYVTGAGGAAADGVERAAGTSFGEWSRVLLGYANSYHALLWASLAGMLLALVLPLTQRIFKLADGLAAMVAGFKSMLLALLVLTLAWSLSAVCGDLDTAQYLVGLAQQSISPTYLPALTFVLAAAVAFATGSSWGTMGILQPLVIPIAHNLALSAGHGVGSEPYLVVLLGTIASVLTGSVWGDHCSPISDTTILSSMASGCDHIAHVRTQLPYALAVGFTAIFVGSIPTSMGLPVAVPLITGLGLIVAVVFGYGGWRGRREGGAGGDAPPSGGPDGDSMADGEMAA
ncbi:MAG: Na+/H+ antiporter NhaC family protein [Acidobacteriota bacterium]